MRNIVQSKPARSLGRAKRPRANGKTRPHFLGLGSAIKNCRPAPFSEADYNRDAVEILFLLDDFAAHHDALFSGIAFSAEPGRLHVYFASKSEAFDVALSDKLAEFETRAVDRLTALRVETQQIPPASLEEYRDLTVRPAHAHKSRTYRRVEAQ